MKGDFSRRTFQPARHFSGIMLQQGRVALDADFNEHVEAWAERLRIHSADTIGPQGTPWDNTTFGGFQVWWDGATSQIKIGTGHYYVQGMLCQNDDVLDFAAQPNAGFPTTPGQYLVYLEAWPRVVTALTHPDLREPALGGNDSAARLMTTWQVRMTRVGELGDVLSPGSWPPGRSPDGNISTGKVGVSMSADPPDNRLYRVEVHQGGDRAQTTFKWSRDNGAVASPLLGVKIVGGQMRLTLDGNGRDNWSRIAPGDWIELINEELELQHLPGVFLRVDQVVGDDLVVLAGGVSGYPTFDDIPWPRPWLGLNPDNTFTLGSRVVVRRWDMAWNPDKVLVSTQAPQEDNTIPLEGGLSITWSSGSYLTGDYWLLPVRTGSGLIDWSSGELRPSQEETRAFARLALLTVEDVNGVLTVTDVADWRDTFPTLGSLTASVGTLVTGSGEVDRVAVWRQDGQTSEGAPIWMLEASTITHDANGVTVGDNQHPQTTTLHGSLRFGTGPVASAIINTGLAAHSTPTVSLPTVSAVREYVDTRVPGGTEGYVTRWSSAGNLTSGGSYDSGSRLAVGTNQPAAAIHAQANVAGDVALIVRGESTSGATNLQEWQAPGLTLSVVDRQGRLGLGVSTPQARLHVNGSIRLEFGSGQAVTGINNDPALTLSGSALQMPTDSAVKTYVDRRTLPGVVSVYGQKTGGGDGGQLTSDGSLTPAGLALGLAIYVQSTPLVGAVPTWTAQVYVEADYVIHAATGKIVAYRPLHLQAGSSLGSPDANSVSRLFWTPTADTVAWLNAQTTITDTNRVNRYLARLVISGDTLWPAYRPGPWELWFWLGTGPLITLSATTLTFDSRSTNPATNSATLTITNPGSGTLKFTTIAAPSETGPVNFSIFSITVNGSTIPTPYTDKEITSGGTMVITLRCSQTVAEVITPLTATLNLPTNINGSTTYTVNLVKPAEPSLSVSPTTLNSFTPSVTSTATTTVTNVGGSGSVLSVTNITSSNAHFTVSPTSFSLSSGAQQVVTVTSVVGPGENIQAFTGALTFTSNSYTTAATVSCSKAGLPSIGVSPSPLTTFNTSAGSTQSVTITNAGAATLTISSITSNNTKFVPAVASLTVNAGATATLNISCNIAAGDEVQTLTGTITLLNNASAGNNAVNGTAYALTVTKSAPAAALSASTGALNFTAGSTSTQSFTVSNTGGGTISLSSSWSSGASSYFTYTQAPPASLGAGASATVIVQCLVSGSTAWAKLTHSLTLNGGAAGSRVINLNKAGQPALQVSTQTLTFDDDTNSTRSVTVTNIGAEGNLTSSSLTLSDTVRYAVSPSTFNLAPAGFIQLNVTSSLQSGDATQTFSRSLTINTNGVNTTYNATPGRAVITLDKPAIPPALSRTPSSLSFTTTTSSTKSVTITNAGGGTLSLSYSFSGTDAARFSLDAGYATSLGAGGSGTTTVRCTVSSAADDYSATLTISSNGGSSTVTLEKGAYEAPPPSGGEDPPTGGCFDGATLVLMADGSSRRISDLQVGDDLMAVPEVDVLAGRHSPPVSARVLAVLRHEEPTHLLNVGGLLATGEHRFARRGEGGAQFRPLRDVAAGEEVLVFDGQMCRVAPLPEVTEGGPTSLTWNLTTTSRTYLVSSNPTGPWYVVHNKKIETP